jgi:alkaline phosphatase D
LRIDGNGRGSANPRSAIRNPQSVGALFAIAALCLAGCSAPSDGSLTRIAFGSCAHQDKPQPIWDVLIAARPDLYIALGDNIYADTKDMEVMKAKYAKLAAVPGWQRLRAACPILSTWDDHDYGWNDAGVEYEKKVESQQIFLDFFGDPADSVRRTRPGVYDARVFGPEGRRVQIIILDTRYFRSPLKRKDKDKGPYVGDDDPAKTMLGEDQWKWLAEQFRVPAELRIVVSSIQVIPEDHGSEKWGNFPLERDRFFKLIKDTGAAGVVFLSGDRHLAELSMLDADVGYPLYDLTSSGLNQASANWRKLEVNRHRVATMNRGNNFGWIEIDWSAAEPKVSLQIRNERGAVVIRQDLELKLLRPGTIKPPAAPK